MRLKTFSNFQPVRRREHIRAESNPSMRLICPMPPSDQALAFSMGRRAGFITNHDPLIFVGDLALSAQQGTDVTTW